MSRKKIDSIIQSLSLCSEKLELPASFADGSVRQWRCVLDFLDRAGLALYFLRQLEASKRTDALPEHMLIALQQRQSKNMERMSLMRCMFELLNRRFREAGVVYAVLKGFSLVPDYCPDASLRVQSDLDYLIARSSKDAASRILNEQGLVLKKQKGEEFVQYSGPGSNRAEYAI